MIGAPHEHPYPETWCDACRDYWLDIEDSGMPDKVSP